MSAHVQIFRTLGDRREKIHLGGNLSYEHSSSVRVLYGF